MSQQHQQNGDVTHAAANGLASHCAENGGPVAQSGCSPQPSAAACEDASGLAGYAAGPADQYADAAMVYDAMLGSSEERTKKYRHWMAGLLRDNSCSNILDVSCGTGVDSIMLLEEGFNVVSTDASDQMLKYALKQRWVRRKEPQFDNWVIEQGNWLTLVDDLRASVADRPTHGYDAIICMGNSFGHVGLLDVDGQPVHQRKALINFKQLIKPGGLLILDHRNYDEIFAKGRLPDNIVYYNGSSLLGTKCTTLCVDGKPAKLSVDYTMNVQSMANKRNLGLNETAKEHKFRLSSYPLLLNDFTGVLHEVFGEQASYDLLADFKPVHEINGPPSVYTHIIHTPI